MLGLFRSTHRPIIEDVSDRLVLRIPHRSRAWGEALVFIALILGLAAIAIDFERSGSIVALLCGGFGLWLVMSYDSVTFDISQQKVFFARHYPFLEKGRRNISFEEIVTIHLDYYEQVVVDDYLAENRIRRKWKIFFVLDEGQAIAVVDETTEHPARQISVLAKQLAYWEDVAAKICTATDKLLVRSPSVPGTPHTFVEQIDQIVKRRLAQSQINDQSVCLRSQMDGTLEIEVDGKIYQDLSKVDDIAVRNLIQAAIKEWQDSK